MRRLFSFSSDSFLLSEKERSKGAPSSPFLCCLGAQRVQSGEKVEASFYSREGEEVDGEEVEVENKALSFFFSLCLFLFFSSSLFFPRRRTSSPAASLHATQGHEPVKREKERERERAGDARRGETGECFFDRWKKEMVALSLCCRLFLSLSLFPLDEPGQARSREGA